MLSINHKFIFSVSSKGLCSGAQSGKVSKNPKRNIKRTAEQEREREREGEREGVATSDHTRSRAAFTIAANCEMHRSIFEF